MRELTGKSQTEFGALFKLSRGKINSYEGNSEPKIVKLIEIAHYFCISVETMVLVDLRTKKFKLKPDTSRQVNEPQTDYVTFNESGLEDIADFVTEHHTELLKNKTYRFWFEKEVFEKSLDVVKEKMGE
ncbi:MAG: helix-turn-helix domain-containing protein [Flavobacteriaceae bacterium]|nr:helix-turn-helix domain-containing protein [Flavobacteriaceae bacterium]